MSGRDRLRSSDRCRDRSQHDRSRLLPAFGLGGSVRIHMFVGEVAVTQFLLPPALVTACGHECGLFCPLTARGQWREYDEPGVSNRRVWRWWLSPRLLLSLDRLLLWPLFLWGVLQQFSRLLCKISPGFFLSLAGSASQGAVAGLAATTVPASGE